jgi:serine O-acetyltransferase
MPGRLVAFLDSIKARDPAPRSRWEILTYPGVWALAYHRIAHALFRADLFFLARLVNHWSRLWTSIDIHPGATIGRNFFIDHGFSVIGETSVIGDDVTIYQNVTLGGTNPVNGVAGKRSADRRQCGGDARRARGRDDGRHPRQADAGRCHRDAALHPLWHDLRPAI